VHVTAHGGVEHPLRDLDASSLVLLVQSAAGDQLLLMHTRLMNPDEATKPRMPGIQNFSGLGTMGVLLMTCTTCDDRISRWTRGRRMRCTSPSQTGVRRRDENRVAHAYRYAKTIDMRRTELSGNPQFDT
jgi:hypothetical protein